MAGGVDEDDPSPRSIGRAGATLVSDDAEGALALSPAALARRSATRFRMGIAVRERSLDFTALDGSSPTIGDQSSASFSPALFVATSLGPWVFGAAYYEPEAYQVRLPSPAFAQPPADVAQLFPHRYNGVGLDIRARELRAGAAVRVTDWAALGAALGVQYFRSRESRILWPGFSGRDGLANPARDLKLDLEADAILPGAAIGLLVAPAAIPVEATVGASARLGRAAHGSAAAIGLQPTSPAVGDGRGDAALDLGNSLAVSAGVRAEFGRLAAETGVIARFAEDSGQPVEWAISDLTIVDESGVSADIATVASQWTAKQHVAAQLAVDGEVLADFLWLTAGYRYTQAAAPRALLGPAFAELGGHTIGVGAEAYARGITATLGYSRTFAGDVRRAAGDTMLVNPFDGGTTVVGDGDYDRSVDRFGLCIEVAWDDLLP